MTRDVAQFGSVYALGACGCRFKSCHSEKEKKKVKSTLRAIND